MIRFRSSPLRSQSSSVRLLFGLGIALIAVALTITLDLPRHGATFLLLLTGVFVAAFLAGRDAGLIATVVGATAAVPLQWEQASIPAVKLASLLMFTTVGLGTSVLLSLIKRAVRDAEEARAEAVRASEEADLLMRELRHRTKNDIANVDSLLLYQAQRAEPEARKQLELASSRLRVIRKVHEKLTRTGANPVIQADAFLHDLCSELHKIMARPRGHAIVWKVAPCRLPSGQAVGIGLIVNELVTNAIKYAYEEGQTGEITIRLEVGDRLKVEVADDGGGYAADAKPGTGLRLIKSLCRQLDAKFDVRPTENGTICTITLRNECEANPPAALPPVREAR